MVPTPKRTSDLRHSPRPWVASIFESSCQSKEVGQKSSRRKSIAHNLRNYNELWHYAVCQQKHQIHTHSIRLHVHPILSFRPSRSPACYPARSLSRFSALLRPDCVIPNRWAARVWLPCERLMASSIRSRWASLRVGSSSKSEKVESRPPFPAGGVTLGEDRLDVIWFLIEAMESILVS